MVMYALIVFDIHKHTINHKFPLDPNIYRLLLAICILVRAEPRLLETKETPTLDPGSVHGARVGKCGCDSWVSSTFHCLDLLFKAVMLSWILACVLFGLSSELSLDGLDSVYQIFASVELLLSQLFSSHTYLRKRMHLLSLTSSCSFSGPVRTGNL